MCLIVYIVVSSNNSSNSSSSTGCVIVVRGSSGSSRSITATNIYININYAYNTVYKFSTVHCTILYCTL